MKLTIVDLLQCNDRVGGQALLRILIQQEGLRSDWPLLRWQHGGVLRGGIHGRHYCSGMTGAGRAAVEGSEAGANNQSQTGDV